MQCQKTKMIGTVRLDSIYTESLQAEEYDVNGQKDELLPIARFNNQTDGLGGCLANLQFDATNEIFTFEIDLGNCGMVSEMRTYQNET